MWVQYGIITEGAADKVLRGGDNKASMRIHKCTYQVCQCFVVPQLLEFLEINYRDLYIDIVTLMNQKEYIQALIVRCDTQDFREAYAAFEEMKMEDKNFQFLRTYMKMVEILLAYMRADRMDNWALHVNAFTRMLGPFER